MKLNRVIAMKNMLRKILLGSTYIVIISSTACTAQSSTPVENKESSNVAENETHSNTENHENIILYMTDHDLSGIEKTSESNAYYYRVLIEELPNDRYLVQDFFISGEKFTDPYILTEGMLEYTDNEDTAHPNNYYPREGARTVWYKSGSKELESYYKDNMPTGTWITYYENGQKWMERNYVNGEEHGINRAWNEDGILTHECNSRHGRNHGDCFAKYNSYPYIYHSIGSFENGEKVGAWMQWYIDGSIEKISFYSPVSLSEVKAKFTEDQFKTFNFDVNADGIDDLLISRINDADNFFQGDELFVLTGDQDGKYTLSLSTTNYTSDGGYFFSSIFPRPTHNGFILSTNFSSRGYPQIEYYFTIKNDGWYVSKTTMEGLTFGEKYYCINDDERPIGEYISSMPPAADYSKPCPALPTKYMVISDTAEILTYEFEHRDPPNYYINGDLIEAIEQNEEWVKVSYKNGTKMGWVSKEDLVVSD